MESESSSQSGAESEETSQTSGDAKDEEFLPGFSSLEAYSKVCKPMFEIIRSSIDYMDYYCCVCRMYIISRPCLVT